MLSLLKKTFDNGSGGIDVVLVMFVLGFIVACVKLLFSGNEIISITMSNFAGSDFAVTVGALGGVYALRKHSDNMTGGGSSS